MIIYPDIEVHNGQCVNLKHGSIEAPKIFDLSPVQAAAEFEAAGAEWLHLIDLNAVFEKGDNNEIMREVIRQSNIPVQVGGGIRSSSVIDQWFEHGAARVVIGTAAVFDQYLVEEACVKHPEKIIISIDATRRQSGITRLETYFHFYRHGTGAQIRAFGGRGDYLHRHRPLR